MSPVAATVVAGKLLSAAGEDVSAYVLAAGDARSDPAALEAALADAAVLLGEAAGEPVDDAMLARVRWIVSPMDEAAHARYLAMGGT